MVGSPASRVLRRDRWVLALVALALRAVVVAWAAPLFGPTADGTFYDVVARRIAEGQGYTWLWPDGVVTYAAHYPVGYPALVGVAYAAFGARPVVAMMVNAVFGVLGVVAVHGMLAGTSRRLAFAGGLAMALHPALLLYTPALMTEGITASLLAMATAVAARLHGSSGDASDPRPRRRLVGGVGLLGLGAILGLSTLVRPQTILMAPILGFLVGAKTSRRRGLVAAGLVLATALATCAPWTVRNCVRMNRCALVSVNGGWNLAIGTQTTSGAWTALAVPDACKEVFDEAGKDACFGRAAKADIAAHPGAWLARVPAKLRVTFDYFGAAPWYLHDANPAAFSDRAKVVVGTIETIVSRALLAAALVAMASWPGKRRTARRAIGAVGFLFAFMPAGVVAYLALASGIALLGRQELARAPLVVPATAAVIATTAATHAVFFGAGRYGLLVVPFVTALAFVRFGDPDELARLRSDDG